ncbi:MAG: potassium channel protein [Gemmatimonadaceae bacterium]|nr:potassium channel protein [Gloeobacterales cyanobacterium ES-bin-141]
MNAPASERLRRFRRRLLGTLGALGGLILLGVGGYTFIEGWSPFDALYMTVITLAGVGYGETYPLRLPGRVFTIVLIVLGVAVLGFLVNQIVQALGEGYLREGLTFSRRQRMVKQLSEHYIVCGYGRMGRQICEELARDKVAFIIIESDPLAVTKAQTMGYLALQGDASTDGLLLEAGIERASCVICVLASDADNLYIVLSSRNLNPKVRTVTRASSEEAAVKLRRVGADEVVSPYMAGAKRMAAIALRPGVIDFIEIGIAGSSPLYIEEFRLLDRQSCPYIDQPLQKAALRMSTGVTVLAIHKTSGTLIASPTGETILSEGDVLFCLGNATQLRALTDLLLPIKT